MGKKIFLWIMMLVGLFILIWVLDIFIESNEAQQWPQTNGQMISSLLSIDHLPKLVDPGSDPTRWYGTDVRYEYTVADRKYISDRLSFEVWGTRSPTTALNIMNKYRHQHKVSVYYNPAYPQESILEPANIGDISIPVMLGGLLAIVGFVLLYDQTIEPKTPGVGNHLHSGRVYQKQGKFDLALNEFNKSIALSPQLVEGYKCRGVLYLQRLEWDLAIADFNHALEYDPTDGSVYFNQANAYRGKKDFNKAWELMQKAMVRGVKVNPDILKDIQRGL